MDAEPSLLPLWMLLPSADAALRGRGRRSPRPHRVIRAAEGAEGRAEVGTQRAARPKVNVCDWGGARDVFRGGGG